MIPALLVAVVGCSSNVYPSAHEASQACDEWEKEKDGRSCQADSPWHNAIVDPSPTILGFEGIKVSRRFKWKIQ